MTAIKTSDAPAPSAPASDEASSAAEATRTVQAGELSFCKFLSSNDTGETGAHQAGIYIPKSASSILFHEPGVKGENKKGRARIHWPDGTCTESSFTYYGKGTRDEYRITCFGRGFEYLRPRYTGALFVLCRMDAEDYKAFIFNTEDEINGFLDNFGLSPADTNVLIGAQPAGNFREIEEIQRFITTLKVNFPDSRTMSATARDIEERVWDHADDAILRPDKKLVEWIRVEYALFKAIEIFRYQPMIEEGFRDIDEFLAKALKILNSRKSRAGKSLEHHLTELFTRNRLLFETQVRTEGRKTVDFLFPSAAAYHDEGYSSAHLVSLAAKTTCKDRWRQILNEADRLRDGKKYLCTLQRGISSEQLGEMTREGVVLVVPKPYIKEYPAAFRADIWTVKKFIDFIRSKNHVK